MALFQELFHRKYPQTIKIKCLFYLVRAMLEFVQTIDTLLRVFTTTEQMESFKQIRSRYCTIVLSY